MAGINKVIIVENLGRDLEMRNTSDGTYVVKNILFVLLKNFVHPLMTWIRILKQNLAPVTATIIQMAISRDREYLADSMGANIANDPNGLAQALKKLESYSRRSKMKAKPINCSHVYYLTYAR